MEENSAVSEKETAIQSICKLIFELALLAFVAWLIYMIWFS